MNERVLVLRDAVVKITQMLSGKGIKVTQRGIGAYVKTDHQGRPIVVNLPYLPDNSTDELCAAIQGFLDHEVAHILFTDFTLLPMAAKLNVMPMFNILEDARIEKAMAQRFSGCGHNLAVTGKFFLDKYTTPMMNEAIMSKDANKLVAVLIVPQIRAMAGQFLFQEFMSDKMSYIQPVFDKIKDLQPKIEAAASSQDCLDLAVEIEKRMRPPGKPNGGEGKTPEDKGSGADSTSPSKAKSKSSKEEKKADEEKGKAKEEKSKSASGSEEEEKKAGEEKEEEKKAGEEEEEEGASEKDETEPPSEEEGEEDEEEGKGSDDDEEDLEFHGSSLPPPSEDSSEDSEDEISINTSAMMDAIDFENKNGYEDKMSAVISSETLEASKDAEYMVFTKDDDKVEPFKVGRDYHPSMFQKMAEKVDHMVGPLQKDLERAIAARSLSTWEAGKRSGRLHSANLSRLATGDTRIFRRKHESHSKDVAVSLVIDASGSMSGEKIHLAAQSAYALSSVLERIGIKHEVICFTTGEAAHHGVEFDAEVKKLGRRFSRMEPLYMPIIKGYEERLNAQTRERFGWLPNSRILRNNIDGECIEIAARRLKQRRESGKVMIVLSDGSPNAYGNGDSLRKHLKQVIKDVTKSGVNIVGLGILTDCVTNFYPKNLIINNVEELPNRVVKELKHLLVQ